MFFSYNSVFGNTRAEVLTGLSGCAVATLGKTITWRAFIFLSLSTFVAFEIVSMARVSCTDRVLEKFNIDNSWIGGEGLEGLITLTTFFSVHVLAVDQSVEKIIALLCLLKFWSRNLRSHAWLDTQKGKKRKENTRHMSTWQLNASYRRYGICRTISRNCIDQAYIYVVKQKYSKSILAAWLKEQRSKILSWECL